MIYFYSIKKWTKFALLVVSINTFNIYTFASDSHSYAPQFYEGKGETVKLVTPYDQFLDIFTGKEIQLEDSHQKTYSPLELIASINGLINKIAPKDTLSLAQNLAVSLNNSAETQNSFLDLLKAEWEEFKVTAVEGVDALQNSKGSIIPEPPGVNQVIREGIKAGVSVAANYEMDEIKEKYADVYSEAIKEKLEVEFKSVYEKFKDTMSAGSMEQVRNELFKKSLVIVNEYMESIVDPTQFATKALIVGGNPKLEIFKQMTTSIEFGLRKLISSGIEPYADIKSSIGLVLHSPKKVTTLNKLNSKVVDESIELSATPALWSTIRIIPYFKKFKEKALEQNPDPASLKSRTDNMHFLTLGYIKAQRDYDISGLVEHQGYFVEFNVVGLGVTANINLAVFLESITPPLKIIAYAITTSVDASAIANKESRTNNMQDYGKIKFVPTVGFVRSVMKTEYSLPFMIK